MIRIKRSELKQLAQDKLGDDSIKSQNKVLVMISTAMAARVSYTIVGDEKVIDYQKQLELHDKLVSQDPPHSSPFEHCARAMTDEEYYSSIKTSKYPIISCKTKKDKEINGGIVTRELYPQHPEYGKNVDMSMFGWCNNIKGFIPYRYMIDNNLKI